MLAKKTTRPFGGCEGGREGGYWCAGHWYCFQSECGVSSVLTTVIAVLIDERALHVILQHRFTVRYKL